MDILETEAAPTAVAVCQGGSRPQVCGNLHQTGLVKVRGPFARYPQDVILIQRTALVSGCNHGQGVIHSATLRNLPRQWALERSSHSFDLIGWGCRGAGSEPATYATHSLCLLVIGAVCRSLYMKPRWTV